MLRRGYRRQDDLYRDLLGGASAFDTYRLLQGLDNKTLEANRALWQLGREAVAVPEVREVLQTCPAADVPAALASSPAGRAFLGGLNAFLEQHGQRSDKFGLDCPCWIEDPTPVSNNLKDYSTQPDRDLAADLAALAAERERLVAEARERLKGYPRPVVGQFETLLKAAQIATVLGEDHAFWMEFPIIYRIRRLLLEFGRRFAEAGALDTPNEVFYLTLGELRDTAAALPRIDGRGIVAARRAERERFSTVSPPAALGTPLPGPPPESPVARIMGKFFGGPPRPSSEPVLLRGSPGSPGMARGPAKVVRLLAEADKLRPGDILVAETTLPAWTPLFATVAAVVADSGGVLSHCAVVAREYRIPAVVGAGVATRTIRDGQIVEVDGDTGVVRIVSPA